MGLDGAEVRQHLGKLAQLGMCGRVSHGFVAGRMETCRGPVSVVRRGPYLRMMFLYLKDATLPRFASGASFRADRDWVAAWGRMSGVGRTAMGGDRYGKV